MGLVEVAQHRSHGDAVLDELDAAWVGDADLQILDRLDLRRLQELDDLRVALERQRLTEAVLPGNEVVRLLRVRPGDRCGERQDGDQSPAREACKAMKPAAVIKGGPTEDPMLNCHALHCFGDGGQAVERSSIIDDADGPPALNPRAAGVGVDPGRSWS